MTGFRRAWPGLRRHRSPLDSRPSPASPQFDWDAPLCAGGPPVKPGARSRWSRKRIAVLCIAALCAAAVCIAVVFLWPRAVGPSSPTDSVGLYPVPVGDKYGYIDRSGRMVIQP